ncbi:hypothetical protein A9W99_11210 [Mycobacterium sp. 1164966.3]|uniref:ATP-dependent DNA ligase n=1 Tax=Mycobacterium sp. 1164966.3 TaxID=1856861 RepID=UPI0007FDED2C|nr:hypothetical protein [Mycobacterium sp. 1164966.3]OBA82672.1 hypothetical protein A9W99_11210 [Mycobacterium sp. 1164966.3]
MTPTHCAGTCGYGPPAHFADFAVEAKYDGQRGLAIVDGEQVALLSRNRADITRTFPEIAAALPTAVGQRSVILDGEIVALDDDGVPCFSRLQRRWPQNRRPSAELLRQVPVRFFVFDVLQYDGKDTSPVSHMRPGANDSGTSHPVVEVASFNLLEVGPMSTR